MVILGFTCVFLGFVIAIMFLMALSARGIAEENRRENSENSPAETDEENR